MGHPLVTYFVGEDKSQVSNKAQAMIGDFILAQNNLSLLMLFGYENRMFH